MLIQDVIPFTEVITEEPKVIWVRKKDKVQLLIIWGAVLLSYAMIEYFWHQWFDTSFWSMIFY